MPTKFKYQAIDKDGKPKNGVVGAESIGNARMELFGKGLQVEHIEQHRSALNFDLTTPKVSRAELMHFSRQLAAFLHAGIPILEAIHVLEEGTDNKTFGRVLAKVGNDLRGGATFERSVAAHPKTFPSFYRGIVRSAELTGQLDVALNRLASYIERDLEARRKIQSAMAYPLIVAAMSVVTVLVMTVFVLPRFQKFFESLNAQLPLPTRILLAGTHSLSTYWYLVAGFIGAVVLGYVVMRRSVSGKARLDRWLLKTPLIGETARYAIIERFCRILSSMVQAGVPLPEALAVTSGTTPNTVYRAAIDDVRSAMIRGEGLARPIASTGLFPVAAMQMIIVGENTGTLDEQLETTANFFEQELDFKIKRLTTLFEPLVIIFMGLVVGFVALALVSAMYGIFNQKGSF